MVGTIPVIWIVKEGDEVMLSAETVESKRIAVLLHDTFHNIASFSYCRGHTTHMLTQTDSIHLSLDVN